VSTSPTRIDYYPEPPLELRVGDVFKIQHREDKRQTYPVTALRVDRAEGGGHVLVVSGKGFGSARFLVFHEQRLNGLRLSTSNPHWTVTFVERPELPAVDKPENS
jgi:hypothetical protein